MAAITGASPGGNWSATATWVGGVVPGNGDTATLPYPVTVDVDTIIGTSGAAGVNAIVVSGSGSLTVASGKKLVIKGDISLANTVFTMQAGSILEFDSSAASGPPKYKVKIGSAGSQQNSKLVVNGTAGSRCTIRKAPGSGNGLIGRHVSGATAWVQCRISYCDFYDLGTTLNSFDNYALDLNPQNTAFAEVFIDHCTFTNCGNCYVFGCGAANDLIITNNEAIGTINQFPFQMNPGASTTGQRVFRGNVTPISAHVGSSSTSGKEIIFSTSMKNFIVEDNVVFKFRTSAMSEFGPTLSFKENLCVTRGWGVNASMIDIGCGGDLIKDNYLHSDSNAATGDAGGVNTPNHAGTGTVTYDGMVLDATEKNEDGDFVHYGNPTGAQLLIFTRFLALPNSRGRSPGTINGHGNKFTNIRLTHNTIITADNTTPSTSGLAAFWTASGYVGHPGMYEQMKDNLVWARDQRSGGEGNFISHHRNSLGPWVGNATAGTTTTLTDSTKSFPPGTPNGTKLEDAQAVVVITGKTGSGPPVGEVRTITASTATQITVGVAFTAAPDTGTAYSIFSRDTVVSAQVLKNAHYNIGSGTIRDEIGNNPTTKAGYNGFWQTNPSAFGSSDISLGTGTDVTTEGPQFVDPSRNLATFDTAYLGNAAVSTWDAAAGPFAVGDIISNSDAGWYDGAVINYRCIVAHPKSTANSEPGVGSSWQTQWEFASSWRIARATLAASRITDATLGLTNATYIQTLLAWVKAGFAPQNQALKGTASDGTDIGAVAVYTAPAPPITSEENQSTMQVALALSL